MLHFYYGTIAPYPFLPSFLLISVFICTIVRLSFTVIQVTVAPWHSTDLNVRVNSDFRLVHYLRNVLLQVE